MPIEYCDELERNIYKPGITILSSKEGYAFTKCGKAGLIAPENSIDIDKNAVLLFGNSFAEGLHVPDQKKMHSVANEMLSAKGHGDLRIYNVSMSSQLFCDTMWQLPKYLENCGHNIKGFAIVVMKHDLLPNSKKSIYGSAVITQNGQWSLEAPTPVQSTTLGLLKYSLGLNAFLTLGSNLKESLSGWQRHLVHDAVKKQADDNVKEAEKFSTDENLDDYLDWQLAYLRKHTDLPILLLCCIDKPIRTGKGIQAVEESELTRKIAYFAAKNNIQFYSMRESFNELYNENKIVCGFPNTLPGSGHFSIYAHRQIGEVLSSWCLQTFVE